MINNYKSNRNTNSNPNNNTNNNNLLKKILIIIMNPKNSSQRLVQIQITSQIMKIL